MRQRHFPVHRNIVPAHLTLFHHLPGDELRQVRADILAEAEEQTALPFRTAGLRFLGKGCAYDVDCVGLSGMQRRLAKQWSAWLTRQDQQPFRPHVTVQNKTSSDVARRLFDTLSHGSQVEGNIVGLDLWFYRGGPWEHALHAAFAVPPAGQRP